MIGGDGIQIQAGLDLKLVLVDPFKAIVLAQVCQEKGSFLFVAWDTGKKDAQQEELCVDVSGVWDEMSNSNAVRW